MATQEEVTIEQAAHCPRCGEVGSIAKKEVKKHFIDHEWWDVYAYICPNDKCVWYNTGWLVSSNERGIVYQRPQGERGIDKTFKKFSPDQMAMGRRMVEDVKQQDLRDEE
jgi:hypothetical protein